jgi:peptidoglycan/LPS O-acetylase OafA/YrhL
MAPAPPEAILGLDGLRAVSVIAVLLYHGHFEWMRGGFLGVEVFFVISGFLITGLLIKEHSRKGRIDLVAFWNRRLRRLLPALLVFLFCIGTVGLLFMGDRASQFRADLLASLLYVENWYQIHSGSSYFADQGLPLLRHLWSLSVEGQFYLVWPFLLALGMRLVRGRTWLLSLLTAALAMASFGLMIHWADPGNLSSLKAAESLNRVYLGTDTRAFGLLAGALLALMMRTPRSHRWFGLILDGTSLLALVALVVVMVKVEAQAPFLYQGGFLLVDGLTLLMISGLIHPSTGWLKAGLGWRPLEWIGQRSYGLYLWHWPLFRLLWPLKHDWPSFVLRLLVTGVLTELSYRYLETPIRQGALKRWMTPGPTRSATWGWYSIRVATALLVVGGSMAEGIVLARRPRYVDPIEASIQAGNVALDNKVAEGEPIVSVPTEPVLPNREATLRASQGGGSKGVVTDLLTSVTMPETLKGVRLTAIGDSVMKGAAIPLKKLGEASLGEGMIQINAEECRSFLPAMSILRKYKQEDRLGEVVVVHLGTNNSTLPEEQFRKLMDLLSDRRLVLFLTVKSDKVQACGTVNKSLETLVATCPNARLLDWMSYAGDHPDYFYSDQTHLRPEGAQRYAELILTQVATASPKVDAGKSPQIQ